MWWCCSCLVYNCVVLWGLAGTVCALLLRGRGVCGLEWSLPLVCRWLLGLVLGFCNWFDCGVDVFGCFESLWLLCEFIYGLVAFGSA